MNIQKIQTTAAFSTSIALAAILFGCSESSSSSAEGETSQKADLILTENNAVNGFIALKDTSISGDLTIESDAVGETILDGVTVSGKLTINRPGRVDFSGSAESLEIQSDNTDVYAISDVAEISSQKVDAENSFVVTKSFADYQKVDWTEHKKKLSTGITLAYTESGPESGTPIILIHGLTDGRTSWSQVAPVLAEKGYHVYVPEYRGNGKTDKPYNDDDAYTVANLTSDIVAFIDELEIEKPHIVGHSLGSFIAQELAISNADKISSITLIGTGASVDAKNDVLDWLLNGTGDDSFDGIYAYDDTQKLPEAFIQSWGYSTNPDSGFQNANLEHLRQTPYYVWKSLVNNLLKFDNTDRLDKISGDVQIIWGTEDALFPESAQDAFKKGLVNANVTFHAVEGADHNTHWGSEEAVNTVSNDIDDFVKSLED